MKWGILSDLFHPSSFILQPCSRLQGVVNPVAKKWHCGADIPVCFFLVKQEDRM